MTSRERVITTIEHREPDRIPCVFRATPEVDKMVMQHFGLNEIEQIRDMFGVENISHWPFQIIYPRNWDKLQLVKVLPDGTKEDLWGVRRKAIDYGLGVYEEIVSSPLASANSIEEIKQYQWPSVEEVDFSNIREDCLKFKDYARALSGWCIFETAWAMRGFQQFLMDLVVDQALVWSIIEQVRKFWIQYNEHMLEQSGGEFDIFLSGDDMGSQTGLLISKQLWKEYFGSGLKEIYSWAKKHRMKTVLHCDGATRGLLPDLIEFGLDVYDPFQPQIREMDPYKAKKEFGKDLCLHGTVDVQRLLPFGKTEEVRNEVKRQIEQLGPGGGFFLAPTHRIQPGTPIENICAVYETAKRYASY